MADCGRRTGGRTGRFLVREATAPDLPEVATAMTIEDRAEMVAMTGLSPTDALAFCHSQSADAWAVVDRKTEDVIALGGVAPDPDEPCANVWLLCTPAVTKSSRAFLRLVRRYVRDLSLRHGLLYGYVDDRNALRKRWLKSLGFTITDERAPAGLAHLNIPFRLFVSQPSD